MDPAEKKLRPEVYPNIPRNHHGGEDPGNGCNCKLLKPAACAVIMSIVFVILITAVVALAVLVSKPQPQPQPQPPNWCPADWIGYQGKCYFFSEVEKNWTNSQNNCSVFGASLAVIDSKQEMAFMMRYKGISEHWIGLQREQEMQSWKWVNGSDFNNTFHIRGGGNCAYLNDNGVSSSRCTTDRNWVCSKPVACTSPKNATEKSWWLKTFGKGFRQVTREMTSENSSAIELMSQDKKIK